MVQAGNVVKANDATLVTINQVAPVYVTFAVPERDLAEIRRRQADGALTVEAEDPATGKTIASGTLTFIDNTVDRTTGTITLKATFPNADRALWPGQFVNARITLATRPRRRRGAAASRPDRTAGDLRLRRQGRRHRRAAPRHGRPPAARRRRDRPRASSAGERVVTDGQLRLRPGTQDRGSRSREDGGDQALVNISEIFIRRPVMTTLVMAAILIFGMMGYRLLPVSDLPNVDFPTIQVAASLPGASPETMASSVATPLERQFSTIAGLDYMSSSSTQGSTQITLQFNLSPKPRRRGAGRPVRHLGGLAAAAAEHARAAVVPEGEPRRSAGPLPGADLGARFRSRSSTSTARR